MTKKLWSVCFIESSTGKEVYLRIWAPDGPDGALKAQAELYDALGGPSGEYRFASLVPVTNI